MQLKTVEEAVRIIKNWNFLCLNEDKTEVLLIASKTNCSDLDIPEINIGEKNISPTKEARNRGFVFDCLMDCKSQIKQTCKSGWFYL